MVPWHAKNVEAIRFQYLAHIHVKYRTFNFVWVFLCGLIESSHHNTFLCSCTDCMGFLKARITMQSQSRRNNLRIYSAYISSLLMSRNYFCINRRSSVSLQGPTYICLMPTKSYGNLFFHCVTFQSSFCNFHCRCVPIDGKRVQLRMRKQVP